MILLALVILLAATSWSAALAVPSAAGAGPALRGAGVRGYAGGVPSTAPAGSAPGAVDVRGLTVSRGSARVELAGPYQALGPGHEVALTLSPPGAAPRRLVLAGDGEARIETLFDGDFVAQGPAEAIVDGAVVAFALPAEVGPSWGVQAHAFLPEAEVHSHTPVAPLGALTGALPPVAVAGAPVDAGGAAWHLPPVPLPGPVRPVAVTVEQRTGGPAVVVELAAPPAAVPDLRGEPVTGQSVTVVLGDAADPGAPRIVADPAAATGTVSVDGRELAFPFAFGAAPAVGPAALLPADAPARAGTAVSSPVTCGPPESYVVDVSLAAGELVIRHFDGDVARGPVDAVTGAGTLTSPDGRTYQVAGVTGPTITVSDLRYNGCSHRVTITLDAPFVPAAPPPPAAITDATPVHVESHVLTAGGGVLAVGPEIPLLALVAAAGTPGDTTAATQPPADSSPPPTQSTTTAPTVQPTAVDDPTTSALVAELAPLGAGAVAAITLIAAAILTRRRPPTPHAASEEPAKAAR